jgi:cell division protein FtsJ|eukprot:Tamp_01074.p2 GENE.Tamp_01074~~Tamp_01074.p2  ORF type:complete len:313 (+),score=20.22 Tamp_01074:2027-2965(+)
MPTIKCDPFYFLAKKYGFRSRAAFKLIELEKKYKILKNSNGIVDLCAAPGSWVQVANKISPLASLIIGIDAQKIRPIKGCYFLRSDITSPNIIKGLTKIKKIDKRKINTVLHDGAPKIGSSWLKDVLNQNELVLMAMKISVNNLEKGGTFITKVFRSEFLHGILYISNCFFERTFLFKPSASRNTSTEIYLVCKKFKAPVNFDPFFFSPDYIFSFFQYNLNVKGRIVKFEKNFTERWEKNFLTLIRIFFKYETDEKTGAKIFDDEFESFFGLSMFSKNFNKSNNSMEKNLHKNINNYKLIIRWTRQFLIESL